MMNKDIEAKSINAKRKSHLIHFDTKMAQNATMLKKVHMYFQQLGLVVADSWFGNDGLWSRLERTGTAIYCFPLR
jgi:hypothetical protein